MGGFQVKPQPWLLVDQTSANLLDGTDAGILGLAFDTIANTGAIPFWQTLAQDGQLKSPEMSFWMTRVDQNGDDEAFGGVFTLGGQNQTLYKGDVEFLPLVTNVGRQTYWLLTVTGMRPNFLDLALGVFSRTCRNYSGHCQRKEGYLAVWRRRCHRYRHDAHRRPFYRRCSGLRPDSRRPATDWQPRWLLRIPYVSLPINKVSS